MSARIYVGLLPWIMFAFIGRGTNEGLAWGGLAAALTAGIIVITSARARSVKELEVFSLTLFTGLMVAGALNQHDLDGLIQRYQNAIAVGALACFALVSLAFHPFTEQYAREVVQRKYWHTARFNRANVELTLMWAAVFGAIAVSEIIAGAFATRLGATIFEWVVPVGLVVVGVQQASIRWSDQFDQESMGLDAMLNQVELWGSAATDGPLP